MNNQVLRPPMRKSAFRCAMCARSWPFRKWGLDIGFDVQPTGRKRGKRHGYRCMTCSHRGWTTKTDWFFDPCIKEQLHHKRLVVLYLHGQEKRMELRTHRPGCYRMTINSDEFAQIVKGRYYRSTGGLQDRFQDDDQGKWWRCEIRRIESGDLIRYAGIHLTLKDAVAEVT